MTNSPAFDLAEKLESSGIGNLASQTGWGIFIGYMPELPDTSIVLYDFLGSAPNPKFLIDRPAVQVRVRGEPWDYHNTYLKALEVRDALIGLPSQDINGTRYVSVTAEQDVFYLERDNKGRDHFIINFNIIREPSSGTYRT